MPEIVCDPPSPCCYPLLSEPGIEESQSLGPDLFLPRARDARGRFVKSSGNLRGRPRGIRNPKRRMPDLVARPLSPQALLNLLERKPELLRPLAAQMLPPPLAVTDPAERLGIDLPSLRTVEDFRQVLATVMTAVARGQIAPAEAACLARRVLARSRALRRCARLRHRLARKARPAGSPRSCPRRGPAKDRCRRSRPPVPRRSDGSRKNCSASARPDGSRSLVVS
jgi:hypothetical protein